MTKKRIGRYEVEHELGAGAMAVVYKAVDPLIGRVVAIKTIRFDSGIGLEQTELRQRLYREAQSAGNLSHTNIVTIYDIGEEDNVAYIAMEFVEGETLQEWMARNPVPPVPETVSIIEQIAAGLEYATARGIIHRDIKPGNILLTSDMKAKIADFGIAKISTANLTQTGAIMGTPAYMSPEQAMGQTLDGRSDIFSLGVIFYEMLTGEKPFAGANPTTILYKILHEDPVPPRQLNVTLHPSFDQIVSRMLAKDPAQRYQSCAELIEDLKNYTSLPANAAGTRAIPVAAPEKPRSGRRFALATLAAFLVIAVGIGGYYVYRHYLTPVPPIPVAGEPGAVDPASASRPAAGGPPPAATQPGASTPERKAGQVSPVPESTQAQPPAKAAAAVTEPAQAPVKEAPVIEKPARAEVSFEFSGIVYPVTVYDGTRKLRDLTSTQSLPVSAGQHRFRLVSEEMYLDQKPAAVRLKPDETVSIPIPGLGGAYIEVPNNAYEGCEIELDGRKLPTPYPAQIPKIAAGEHQVVFRWVSGPYAGKEVSSAFSVEADHLFRVRGDPGSGQVTVQQIR